MHAGASWNASRPDSAPIEEMRRAERIAVAPPVPALFTGTAVQVIEISELGVTAGHAERLAIGRRGSLTVDCPGPAARVALLVRVIRSRMVQTGGKPVYVTGFEVEEESREDAGRLLEALIEAGCARRP